MRNLCLNFAFALSLIPATAVCAPQEVVIGIASNFSEISSSSSNPFGGYFRDGVNLAVKDANGRLVKKGMKIVLREFDYGVSDARVLEAAKSAGESNAVAVLGYNFSSHALLAAPIHQKSGLPMLTPSATANRIGSMGRLIHQGCFDNAFMGETLAHVASGRLKAKTAAIVVAADCAYCTDLAEAFSREFRKGGGEISVSIPVLQEDKSFEEVFNKLKAHPHDVILVPNQELLSARIIASLSDLGARKPFLGGDGWGNVGREFFRIVGTKTFTGYSVSHWHPQERSKASKKFVADYQKEFTKEPNDTSVLAYDSMSILLQAVMDAKTPTRSEIENSLNSMKAFTGVTGKFIFQPGRAPVKSLILLSANNAKFKILDRIDTVQGGAR